MLVEPDRGPRRPTMRVPGANAQDMNVTGQRSVKDCRLRANRPPTIRSKTDARPNAGFVTQSDVVTIIGQGVNAKHAMRRMAKGTQRRKTA